MVEKLGGADLKFGHYRNGAEPPASFLGERKAGPTGEGEDARFGKRPLQERGVRFTHDEKGRRADPVKTFGMRTPHIKRSALHFGGRVLATLESGSPWEGGARGLWEMLESQSPRYVATMNHVWLAPSVRRWAVGYMGSALRICGTGEGG